MRMMDRRSIGSVTTAAAKVRNAGHVTTGFSELGLVYT
jgi:hypothetical protein